MSDRRGITLSYRTLITLLITAGVFTALSFGWSQRDSLAAWWNRPAAQTAVAPVVNVPAPVTNVTLKPNIALKWEPVWVDKTHEYIIDGKRAYDVIEYPFMIYRYNDLETGRWRSVRANVVERVGPLGGVKHAEAAE